MGRRFSASTGDIQTVQHRQGRRMSEQSRAHRDNSRPPGLHDDDDEREENDERGRRDYGREPVFYASRRPGLAPFTGEKAIKKIVRSNQQCKHQCATLRKYNEINDEAKRMMEEMEVQREGEEYKATAIIRTLSNTQVPVHGDPLRTKEEGNVRLIFENWNKMAPWRKDGWKLIKARAMLRKTRGDFYLGTKVGNKLGKSG